MSNYERIICGTCKKSYELSFKKNFTAAKCIIENIENLIIAYNIIILINKNSDIKFDIVIDTYHEKGYSDLWIEWLEAHKSHELHVLSNNYEEFDYPEEV